MTAEEYLERHKEEYKGKIFYTIDDKHSPQLLDLYAGKEVLIASSPVDTPLMNLLEDKLEGIQFQRVDGALDDAILDTKREKTLLDAGGKTEAVRIADFIRTTLNEENTEIEAKSLSADHIPALLIVDEDSRRMRETFALSQQPLPPFLKNKLTFVVNTNNKLVQSIYDLKEKDPTLAKEMVLHLHALTLLGQKELAPHLLSDFIARSTRVLESLVSGSTLAEH